MKIVQFHIQMKVPGSIEIFVFWQHRKELYSVFFFIFEKRNFISPSLISCLMALCCLSFWAAERSAQQHLSRISGEDKTCVESEIRVKEKSEEQAKDISQSPVLSYSMHSTKRQQHKTFSREREMKKPLKDHKTLIKELLNCFWGTQDGRGQILCVVLGPKTLSNTQKLIAERGEGEWEIGIFSSDLDVSLWLANAEECEGLRLLKKAIF